MKVLIAGGTGLIGRKLTEILVEEGDEVVILTRSPNGRSTEGVTFVGWSSKQNDTEWVSKVGKVDAVYNLSGRSISDKWNDDVKKSIESSRIESTRSIVEGIGKMDEPPGTLINASAIGIYGSRGEEILTEDSQPGDDFFAEVCTKWENEAFKAQDYGLRVAAARTSIVLDAEEGALPAIISPVRKGLGSRLGSGKQWMSWIHVLDAARALSFILHGTLQGPVNLASPNPVVNRDFMQEVARSIGKKARIPAPAAILRGIVGEMADYLLLASQRISSKKLSDAGFTYEYPDLAGALASLMR